MGLFGSDSLSLETTSTQATDNSRSYAQADYSTGLGTRIAAGELNNATINVQDPMALMAARDVTLAAIDSNSQVSSRVAGAASLAIEKAFGLGETRSQSESQSFFNTVAKVAPWLLVPVGLGFGFWAWKRWGKAA